MLMAAVRKELLLQWRTQAQMVAVFVFGVALLLLFSFAVGPVADALRQFSAGFPWLALLLSSTLTLSESFHTEMEHRALEGLLLLPADPRAVRKSVCELAPPLSPRHRSRPGDGDPLRRGTLYAAMTAQLRASVKATSLLLLGDPMGQARSWRLLLLAFDAIYRALCGLLFGRVMEELGRAASDAPHSCSHLSKTTLRSASST